MKPLKSLLFCSLLLITGNVYAGDRPVPAALRLQLVTGQVQSPVAMAVPDDGTGRIFICQKEGKIWIVDHGKVLPQPFLDVTDKMVAVNPGYDERGLLGLAFSPHFKTNRKFYVYYSAPSTQPGSNCKNILAEFKVSAKNREKADPKSERILMEFEKPQSNHDGGDLQFGPDGYLYVGLGDGGGAGDKHGPNGNGQNLDAWLGKMLRIDVNSGHPYSVPKSNPFVGRPNVKPEIWAYGLRNPWRFSFDKKTGELFCGDVGQDKYEEVDIIRKGGNYGWRVMEGFHEYNMPPEGADTARMIKPIDEYDHKHTGISIIGGYVYRGKAIPALDGKYIFGDYSGKLFSLTKDAGGAWNREELDFPDKPAKFQVYSFGQDESGELFVLGVVPVGNGFEGKVYKIVSSR